MNEIKPTIGLKFEDRYIEAKNKLIDFSKTFDELTYDEKVRFVNEVAAAVGIVITAEQFAKLMNNGGNY